jgi:hypothetical protein
MSLNKVSLKKGIVLPSVTGVRRISEEIVSLYQVSGCQLGLIRWPVNCLTAYKAALEVFRPQGWVQV